MTAERQAIKVLADEMMKAIKKVTEDNNKSYVANKIKNYNGGTVIGGGGSSGGSISGDINASQVNGLYNTVASYISNAPIKANSGDENALSIMNTLNSAINAKYNSITSDTAFIGTLRSKFAEFINLVATNATIQNVDAQQVRTDIANIGVANISDASIGWAKIGGLSTDTLFSRDQLTNKLYVKDLAVTDANIVSLTAGDLMIKNSEGKFSRIIIDQDGRVGSEEVTFDGNDIINNDSLNGEKIVENTITARELNVASIFASEAMVMELISRNIDVDELFANRAFVNKLSTSTIASQYDLSENQSVINLTQGMIDMIVTSEIDEQTQETRFTLTNNMINAISSQVTFNADRINFNVGENFNAAVSSRVKTELGYRLEITSTSEILTDSITATTLTAKVYQGKNDVTNLFNASQFNWKRISSNSAGDTTWNNDSNHKGKKQLTILTSDVDYSATFTCELDDGQEA